MCHGFPKNTKYQRYIEFRLGKYAKYYITKSFVIKFYAVWDFKKDLTPKKPRIKAS